VKFGDLLGQAISHGIAIGKLRQWPDEVIVTAHWTVADMSAMADFAKINSQFDNVRKSYVSLEPFEASYTLPNRHVKKFDVWLMDTLLLSPGDRETQTGSRRGAMPGISLRAPGAE
jgi:hypothetical protein